MKPKVFYEITLCGDGSCSSHVAKQLLYQGIIVIIAIPSVGLASLNSSLGVSGPGLVSATSLSMSSSFPSVCWDSTR